jgi:hypothetical protein
MNMVEEHDHSLNHWLRKEGMNMVGIHMVEVEGMDMVEECPLNTDRRWRVLIWWRI